MIFLLLLLLGAIPAWGQGRFTLPTPAVREAADGRDVERLLGMLRTSTEIDREVFRALGSVQSEAAMPAIISGLSAPDPRVREMASFAAGQTLRLLNESGEMETTLLQRLSTETHGSVKAALLDALGRFARAPILDSVARASFEDPLLLHAQALSIARFAIRGIKSEAGTMKTAAIARGAGFRTSVAGDFNPAVYASMRIADSALLVYATPSLLDAVVSPNVTERMHAVAALGRMKTDAAFAAVREALHDPEPFVRVNAIRALPQFASRGHEFMQALLPLLKETNYHSLKALLQVLPQTGVSFPRIATTLIGLIDTSSSPDIREEAWRAYAQLYPDLAENKLRGLQSSPTPTPAMLDAAGLAAKKQLRTNGGLVSWLKQFMTNGTRAVATAAIESWGAYWRIARTEEGISKGSPEDEEYEKALLAASIVHGKNHEQNPAAVQAIAGIFKDSLFQSPAYAVQLLEVLHHFSSKDNVETVIAIVDAIGAIGEPDIVERLRELLHDENAAVRKTAETAMKKRGLSVPTSSPRRIAVNPMPALNVASNPEAVIRTNRGRIRVELFIGDAPYTVGAFIRLANEGFYDGLTFHRVVPNFVAQGGDPLGDGTGGPPFTLRSEFSPRTFSRGALGIASAGKDTEGSQFFIMHSAHPHLDGRYTLFGNVLSGMDVVDRIEVGDVIEEIAILE